MFARCLLCVFCLGILIGCGADKDIVEEDEVLSDTDAADSGLYSEDVPEGAPVVTLIDIACSYRGDHFDTSNFLRVDRPLAYTLIAYVQVDEVLVLDGKTEVKSYRAPLGIPAGRTESFRFGVGSYSDPVGFSLTLTLLPASSRKEIELPVVVPLGRDPGPDRGHYFNVPEGHQFQPYRVGTPSQIIHKGEDIVKEEED